MNINNINPPLYRPLTSNFPDIFLDNPYSVAHAINRKKSNIISYGWTGSFTMLLPTYYHLLFVVSILLWSIECL